MARRFFVFTCFLVSTFLVAGCGKGKTVKVSGIVTLDDKPLEGALVQFVPLDEAKGLSASGRTGSDGTFRLTTRNPNDGAVPGEYRVLVTLDQERPAPAGGGAAQGGGIRGDQMGEMMRGFAGEQKANAGGQPKKKATAIPAMYGDPKKTPFQKVVVPADKDIELALRSKGG
jgi:hypothetical protein